MTRLDERLPGDVAAQLAQVFRRPAWALVRLHGSDDVMLLGGTRRDHDRLREVPLERGPVNPGRSFDRLLCVPFAQIAERGFEVRDDATPLSSIEIDIESRVPISDLTASLPRIALETTGFAGFVESDEEYAATVAEVVRAEIGNGEGANVVVARDFRATIRDWDAAKALSVYARLLHQERGSYWTYLVFTGDRYLIGASPESHLRLQGGMVSMNPISGTFRLDADSVTAGLETSLHRFLNDSKEIYELFMVVDEELKMMCALCAEGGTITGPFLKPMSQLIHTEYLLSGRTTLDPRDVLKGSMFAATVTGSPVGNACRLITKYESRGRGYYGAALALLGRDTGGQDTVDAPIVLRTADVSLDGQLRVSVGATLVRDSVPSSEVAETRAKAAGILAAFGLAPQAVTASHDVSSLVRDSAVLDTLAARNARLSRFWLTDQSRASTAAVFAGRKVVVLDAEDEFVAMLRHLLTVLGMTSETVSYRDYRPGVFDAADLVIVGPGPGDPRNLRHPKIAAVRRAVDDLLREGQPFVAVCLGHQVLCGALGFDLHHKDIVFQGTQTRVHVLGRDENVGFYNTFVARAAPGKELPSGVRVDADDTNGDVHLVQGPHYAGVQFHLESILTEHGLDLLSELLRGLLSAPAAPPDVGPEKGHAPAAGDG